MTKTFFNIKLNFNFSKFYEYGVSAQDELGSLCGNDRMV